METRKLQQSDNKFPLFLPKRDLELLGWIKGDNISIDTNVESGTITLKKITQEQE